MTSPIRKLPPGGPGPATPVPAGPAVTLGEKMYNTGGGLLGNPIAGNGVGQVQMPGMPSSFNGNFGFGGSSLGRGDDKGSGYGMNRAPVGGLGSTASGQGAGGNPYLSGMADDITNRTNNMLGQNNLSIQGNSVASGGLGGSRQGVAQGVAAGQAADFMSGNLSKLYGGAYENQMNRNLEQYQGDQQFYTQQRGQDIMGAGMGADLVTKGLNTQWLPLQNAGDLYSKFQGNGTTTNTTDSGGGWQGVVGGVTSGATFGHQMGWW